MMDIFQWSITAILFLIGIYAGRSWDKHDRRVKKDKELIEKILTLIPVDSNIINFLHLRDFGSSYRNDVLTPLWELKRLLAQPDSHFLNEKLERIRKDLQKEMDSLDNLIDLEVFVRDRREGYSGVDKPYGTLRSHGQRKRTLGETISDKEVDVIENRHKEIEELNQLSTNIYYMYNSLISLAHEEL